MMKTLLLLPAFVVAVSLPFAAPEAPTRTLGEHDWVVDPGHSSVVFRIKHAGAAWFHGTFDKIEGSVTLDPAAPAAGKVELTIPVESVDTNDQKRDGHLKSPDFFNAKENPTISFKSTKIADEGKRLMVTGDLTMAGKTNPVTVLVEKTGEGEFYGKRQGFLCTFVVKRSEFGMNYGLAKDVLGDEVALSVALEVTQAK